MTPGASFFGLQRRFADRWAEVAPCPRPRAYLDCTTWYHQACRLGREFDPDHPGWLRFLADLDAAGDPDAFIAERAAASREPSSSTSVFDYAWDPEELTVRLHFQPDDGTVQSPLALEAVGQRKGEIRTVIDRALAEHPEAEAVRGRSWLYNLEAYRRLMPPAFVAALASDEHDLQFLATWGQFLTRRGETRPAPVELFLERIAAASTTAALEEAFPLRILEARVPIAAFVDFYGAG
jgi:hypothetical protein